MNRASILLKHLAGALVFVLFSSSLLAQVQGTRDYGSKPELPAPTDSFFPTVNIAPAKGWPGNNKPVAAPGFAVSAFATDLTHPRWLYVLPNGDVLVAETDTPPKQGWSLPGMIASYIMRQAGSGLEPSANRITLLRDTDSDGKADLRTTFLEGLNSPFGMALVDDTFYVANTDAIIAFTYTEGTTRITRAGTKLVDLPAWPINHHWTKNILASEDGHFLYATVGSNSNVAENGMENEINRAAILKIDRLSGDTRVFASGLRNPNGLAWQPDSGELWTTVNERDEIGDNLVPDYMTSVKDGGFYGWPYSYFGQHVDTRIEPNPQLVTTALVPDYALGAHTASLGLLFYTGSLLDKHYLHGAFISQHGSWNREELSGYRVIFVPFEKGEPAGTAQEILGGFISKRGKAFGRPVDVVQDKSGALLVSDDVGKTVWRLTPQP